MEVIYNNFFLFFRAYWGFADHFKDHAEGLLNSLEITYRRMLQVPEYRTPEI